MVFFLYGTAIEFFLLFFFFFFQAEDGIRDAQESRGLGDVYKRQVSTQSTGDLGIAFMQSYKASSGGQYKGQIVNGRCEGWGRYTFPNSHYYEGEFFNNQFHGKGTMVFPETGRFEGWWEKGCCVKGTYMFGDGLKNDDQQWGYCTESDRRLLSEIKEGLKPAGAK
eukprot:TRINITY_DN5765_c0_g1_i5.p1 TRINITY_DN5765_c0_g1~~TRINITY_DN5765_c0_g1_i5.p1  ORF type:complete len:166 (-),score=51.08 TRINITY_DN5765_c0_g1_i5:280-777(-)